jgi:hypothetical protein
MTETTEFQRAANAAVSALRRLGELSRGERMGDLVAALDALVAPRGPLAELGDLLSEGAVWLSDFELADADLAAERIDDAAGTAEATTAAIEIVLRLIRPLAD